MSESEHKNVTNDDCLSASTSSEPKLDAKPNSNPSINKVNLNTINSTGNKLKL